VDPQDVRQVGVVGCGLMGSGIVEVVARSGAKVTFVEDSTRLELLGGVGGFLRYRISEENAVPYEQGDATPRAKALTRRA